MPADTKKVLWTVFSVGVFLIIVLGVLLVVYYPEADAANAPLAFDASAAARGSVSDEYLRDAAGAAGSGEASGAAPAAAGVTGTEALPAASPLQGEAAKPATAGDITIVYGEKPAADSLAPVPAAGAAVAAPAASPADASAIKRTYTPSAAGAAKPASKPATTSVSSAPAKPKPTAFTEYWIQAASLSSRTRAEELQASLRLKGLSSAILVKDLEGVTWYRVRIGPYPQKAEADGFLATVRKVPGCAEAFVSKVSGTRTL